MAAKIYMGRMFGEGDGKSLATSPLAASCACTVASKDLPLINVALANADQFRSPVLAQAAMTDIGSNPREYSAVQRAPSAGDDRGRS